MRNAVRVLLDHCPRLQEEDSGNHECSDNYSRSDERKRESDNEFLVHDSFLIIELELRQPETFGGLQSAPGER